MKIIALLSIAACVFITGCATEGAAPRTHAKLIHVGVNPTNNTPELIIQDYNNPKDLVIAYDEKTKTFSLKSSNNPSVVDSSAAGNVAYLNAMSSLINSAIQTGIAAGVKSVKP